MSSAGKANTALAAAIIFLLLSSCAAYLAFARLRNSQSWVQHTREVQLALHQFATTETRAARLALEYVDSGDLSLLDRQTETVVQVKNSLEVLRHLIADNQEQQSSYAKLAAFAQQRLDLVSRAIELKRSGRSTFSGQAEITTQILASGDAMDQILQGMYEKEQNLLAEREGRERSSFSVAAGILASSLFLALILFLIHHQLLTVQVMERMRAESAQRGLSARLLNLQDEERRRFARELHDSVGQHLAALKMAVSVLESRLPGDRTVQDCLQLLDEAIAETRTMSHLLHPPLLDEAGLNSASRWFVEGFAKRSGIEVNLDIRDGAERFSEPIELVLFRVLQESLTNVHRHAGTKRADVSLSLSGSDVVLRVKDYGRGIPRDVLRNFHEDGTGWGVGLAGMNERIREMGGRLEINATDGGTEILARVPGNLRRPNPEIHLSNREVVNG